MGRILDTPTEAPSCTLHYPVPHAPVPPTYVVRSGTPLPSASSILERVSSTTTCRWRSQPTYPSPDDRVRTADTTTRSTSCSSFIILCNPSRKPLLDRCSQQKRMKSNLCTATSRAASPHCRANAGAKSDSRAPPGLLLAVDRGRSVRALRKLSARPRGVLIAALGARGWTPDAIIGRTPPRRRERRPHGKNTPAWFSGART
jgi:hypothetical protein